MEKSVLAESRHVHWASELHSEYRSTYRWHEFKQQQEQGVVKQPAPAPPAALPITRGPIEPAMPRRKKYPGMAYKTNELFEPAPTDDIRPQTVNDRARSAQRNDTERAGRRSKSEGPRQPRWTDTVEPKATTALGEVLAVKESDVVSTEYQNQFAWPKDETTPRKSISMGALKKAAVAEVPAHVVLSEKAFSDMLTTAPPTESNWSYKLRNLLWLMHNNFAKDHQMIK